MRRLGLWAGLLGVLAIIIFNIQGWLGLARTTRTLEEELGARLQSVGLTLAALLEPLPVSVDTPTAWSSLQPLLERTMRTNGLYNVFAVSESLVRLADARDPAAVGTTDPTLELDATEILAAFSGLPTSSRLWRAGRSYLKTAYVPLADQTGGVVAVIGVEADARFFSALAALRRSLVIINAISLLAVITIIAALVGLTRRGIVLERAAARTATLALLGQLSAAVAHDIRNPLSIIRAAAERLKKKLGGTDPDPAFDYITDEVDRLNRVITGYLDLGRAGGGQLAPVEPAALVRSCLADLEGQLQQAGIEIELALPELPPVKADRIQLRAAFINIILNAIQAQPGGGRLQISGELRRRGRHAWAILRFADAGPGIPPQLREKVFEPFFTTRDKGSGLGLFSVRRTVESFGGRVIIADRPGPGATIEVSLPI